MVDWSFFNKFDHVNDLYLPAIGEGTTKATQTVTAVTKLVFKWYNDGDVYDNVNSPLEGWCNDLSSYANWLLKYRPEAGNILYGIGNCYNDGEYEDLLAELAELLLDDEDLERLNKEPAEGSIYKCDGPFEFRDPCDDEDDWYEDDYEDDYEDEDEAC